MFSIVLGSNEKRDSLIERLKLKKIPSVIYYKFPIHSMDAFKYLNYKDHDFPTSFMLSKTIVSLPMHPYLASEEIEIIIEAIKIKLKYIVTGGAGFIGSNLVDDLLNDNGHCSCN